MFKFLKKLLPKEERYLFDITLGPFICFTIGMVITVILSNNNVGILNCDVGYGAFISWIIYVFAFMISSIWFKNPKEKDGEK